ncbi:MAG: hypothetical protein J7496_12615 [Novosphingobium sp.]|nr:hypothetical protein [Novosphingobium sp.]MBO9603339.1 hypothetical protein [Novosphingobium sp.]
MTEASPPRRKYAHTYIKPKQRIGERDKLDRHWRKLFLDTLAETSNVSEAARVAEINPSRAYKVRRAEPGFRRQWNAALIEGYEHLEMETLHRLRAGTGKDDPKFDIANALRLLALHRETVMRERALCDEEDEDAILASLDAKIEAMRAREEEAARLLAAETYDDTHDLG